MIEYVRKDQVLEIIKRTCGDYAAAWAEVNRLPAADVAPVVHSYWESYDCSQYMGTDEYGEPKWRVGKFHVCHNRRCRRTTVIKSLYCPNCGAMMDLEVST